MVYHFLWRKKIFFSAYSVKTEEKNSYFLVYRKGAFPRDHPERTHGSFSEREVFSAFLPVLLYPAIFC